MGSSSFLGTVGGGCVFVGRSTLRQGGAAQFAASAKDAADGKVRGEYLLAGLEVVDVSEEGQDGKPTIKLNAKKHETREPSLVMLQVSKIQYKVYSSTYLAMGFAYVRAGTQKRRAVFGYPPEH